jgi:hypothetical protein
MGGSAGCPLLSAAERVRSPITPTRRTRRSRDASAWEQVAISVMSRVARVAATHRVRVRGGRVAAAATTAVVMPGWGTSSSSGSAT